MFVSCFVAVCVIWVSMRTLACFVSLDRKLQTMTDERQIHSVEILRIHLSAYKLLLTHLCMHSGKRLSCFINILIVTSVLHLSFDLAFPKHEFLKRNPFNVIFSNYSVKTSIVYHKFNFCFYKPMNPL